MASSQVANAVPIFGKADVCQRLAAAIRWLPQHFSIAIAIRDGKLANA